MVRTQRLEDLYDILGLRNGSLLSLCEIPAGGAEDCSKEILEHSFCLVFSPLLRYCDWSLVKF